MKTLGIDLGTTNTAAALGGDVLALAEGGQNRHILPSVIAFPPTGAVLIGAAARRRRAIDASNTIFSAKRIIGRGWFALEVRDFQKRYPFELVRQDEAPAFKTRAGVFTAAQIATNVLAEVKRKAGVAGPLVLGVPSGFQPAQREATAGAAHAAGFTDVTIIDEPVATAWAYLGTEAAHGRYAAVFDLGGGTFDLAVVDCATQPFRVLGHGGDSYLGGDDIDHALAEWAAQEVLAAHRWDLRGDPEVYDRLVSECERAKIRLSFADKTVIEPGRIDPAAPDGAAPLTLDRKLLSGLCTDLVRRTFSICDEVLARVGVKASAIDAVFLAGGSTQLPMVRAGVEAYFGKPPRCDFDPMEVVSIGASQVSVR